MSKVIAFTGGSGLLAVNMGLIMSEHFDIILILHKKTIELPNVKTVFVNLNSIDDINHCLNFLKVDILINCAAMTSVEACDYSH